MGDDKPGDDAVDCCCEDDEDVDDAGGEFEATGGRGGAKVELETRVDKG